MKFDLKLERNGFHKKGDKVTIIGAGKSYFTGLTHEEKLLEICEIDRFKKDGASFSDFEYDEKNNHHIYIFKKDNIFKPFFRTCFSYIKEFYEQFLTKLSFL